MTTPLPLTIEKGLALRRRLATGDKLLGAWSTLGSTHVAALMAHAGYDFLLVDLEHGQGGIDTVAAQVQAVLALPTAIVVRCPDHSTATLKRVLDAGANAVLLPMVDTVEQARAIVAACRYAPQGARGVAIGAIPASDYGYRAESYFEHANAATTIVVQIETPAAVQAATAIADVDGIDGFFIGPNDLSAAMGLYRRYDDPLFVQALDRVEAAAKAAGRILGALPYPQRGWQQLFAAGHQLVPATSDQMLLRQGSLALVDAHRRPA
ncbi:MAG: aldolase/citrate lyase family protein [Burkholderiaceae bacterium]